MKNLKTITAILVPAVMMILFCQCGYKLSGFNTQIPESLRTIAIPDFENQTTRFQADQYITFALKEEFIKRSKLVLVDSADNADSLLEGTIKKFLVDPLSYADDDTANLYRITITISVRFINLSTNEIIFEGEDITFSDSYTMESQIDVDDDFFAQETESLLKIASEFAASVVTTILENF